MVQKADKKPKALVLGVGAERGIGGGVSKLFAKNGHHVLVAGRTADKIGKVVEVIGRSGGSASPVTVDGTKEDEVIRLFDKAMADDVRGLFNHDPNLLLGRTKAGTLTLTVACSETRRKSA